MGKLVNKEGKEAGKGLYKLHKEKPKLVEEKMGYTMQMGMKETDSPTSFSTNQSKVIQMAPLGPMLNTHDANGVNPIDTSGFQVIDQTSDAYVGQQGGVQGIFTDVNTTLERGTEGTDPVTTKRKRPLATEFGEKCGTKSNPKATSYVSDIDGKTRPCKWTAEEDFDPESEFETITTGGTEGDLEQKQETETTFQAAPTRDVLDNFEARQAQRNVGQAFRKAKRATIQEERANLRKDIKGSDLTRKERKDKRKAFRDRKREIKANAKKYAALGKRQVAQDILNQTIGGRTQSQTRSENVKYDSDGKPVGFEDKDLVMLMKPMQFRKKY